MSQTRPERSVHTKDLLTPASAITAISGGLAVYGATHIDTLKGVCAFTLARAGDKLDGTVARLLQQESDAGAIFDTVVDKAGIGLAAAYGWQKEVIPRPAIACIGIRSVASVGLTALMAHNHPNESFRPTTAGKIAMGAESVALIAYAGAQALEKEAPGLLMPRTIAQNIGHAAMATTIAAGAVSLAQYTKRAIRP